MSLFIDIENIENDNMQSNDIPVKEREYLEKISLLDEKLFNSLKSIISTDFDLTRQLVSFQANKIRPFYRWYKYKEGFSAELVKKYILKYGFNEKTKLLDPFAGSGTALFVSSELGFDSCGIELLPIGQEIIETRNALLTQFTENDFQRLEFWIKNKPWNKHNSKHDLTVLKITNGAYPDITTKKIQQYLSCIENESIIVKKVLKFSLLCVLENISYTRKDGQYLRWDQRSGRCLGSKPFDKGEIKNFDDAIISKLNEIVSDSKGDEVKTLFDTTPKKVKYGNIEIVGGSCITELPKMQSDEFDLIITSPPYCNRYDYTRTYALELALLGTDEQGLIDLRQTMLSCTVENRQKDLLDLNSNWSDVIQILNNQKLLQLIIEYLEYKKETKTINNNGIPRMIKGYFYELGCVIYELHRVLKKNGRLIMVNDNVRYAGASISVDLLLSDIAHEIGFEVEQISVLPNGKGNSSQQMGLHGREQLRKCVYKIGRAHV